MGRIPDGDGDDPALERLAGIVRTAVAGARRRWTSGELERVVAAREACPRPLVRKAIRRLIASETLEYTYIFGQSYLEMSFRRPVEVGARFIILPPHAARERGHSRRLPLVLAPGGAFGSGRHPTTRIALESLERAWAHLPVTHARVAPSAIDIGTGSGILAIAAARLGAAMVLALDIDACARAEARQNVILNTGVTAVTVTDTPLTAIRDRFSLAMANLRSPSLVALAPYLRDHLLPGGCIVVSGLRVAEWGMLDAVLREKGFRSLWQKTDAAWTGGVFIDRQKTKP